ncbi:MAG TPA: 5-formyltetrahydrofolate cyclo-ligase, partial [Burkholderiales bacterium]|nr:5-formyltetrahydrofolate cyclo-ligase [Burkholderiales bacterium]
MTSSESPRMDWDSIKVWRKARRAELIARREALLLEQRRAWNEKITGLLIDGFPLPPDTIVGFCWPYKAEFDPRFALRRWREHGVTSALPEVVGKGEPLKFRKWSPGVAMRAGVYDIPFPVGTDEVVPDVAIVPMNGFDEQGYRLGYGGGYFDRTLAKWGSRMLVIGVSYEALRLQTIYPQPHDIPMDFVVTETGIHLVRGGRLDLIDEAASAAHTRCLFAARHLPRSAPAEPGGQFSSPPC